MNLFKINSPPKEGDIYKTIHIDEYIFELRYGYYEKYERETGEPVVIYPDLTRRIYTWDGYPIVTAIQEPCSYYEVFEHKAKNECCVDCIHYYPPDDDIGVCKCKHNQKKSTEGDAVL